MFGDCRSDAVESQSKSETESNEEQCQTQSEAQAALQQFWPKVMDEIKLIRNVGDSQFA